MTVNGLRTAWCLKCDKPADSWDETLVKNGIQRKISCHGETTVGFVSYNLAKNRLPEWLMQREFAGSNFEMRDRTPE